MRYEVTLMVEVSNVEAPDEDTAAQIAIGSVRRTQEDTIAIHPVLVEEAAPSDERETDVPAEEGESMVG